MHRCRAFVHTCASLTLSIFLRDQRATLLCRRLKNRHGTVTWTTSWMQAHGSTQFPDMLFNLLVVQTQRIIKLSLTASPKHGQQCLDDTTPVLTPAFEQPQVDSNFFQAPTSPSHSTCLTCFSTGQSHAPSKSSNCPLLHPPNMDANIGRKPCTFSCLFVSNCNWVQSSSKHWLVPLTPLA
jgi:hypothetical protein